VNDLTLRFLLGHAPLSLRKLVISNNVDGFISAQVKEAIREFPIHIESVIFKRTIKAAMVLDCFTWRLQDG